MDLLAAEITARTGKDPGEYYQELTAEFGAPCYTRIDEPATTEQKTRLKRLSPQTVKESSLAGEPILAKQSRAPGNDASIDGLKLIARSGWFAARPSGTEAVYKIYAESFKDVAHLDAIVREARKIRLRRVSRRERKGGVIDRGGAVVSTPLHRNTGPPAFCRSSPPP